MESSIEVDVVYARAHEQTVVRLEVPAGTTAGEAVTLSGLVERFPEIGAAPLRLGVYGRGVDAAAVLGPGDRVEIYRPLIADPKLARRERARAR